MPIAADTVETSLSVDLSRAFNDFSGAAPSPPPLSPALDLDSTALPPLDDFSSVEEALGDLTDDLGALAALDIPLSTSPMLTSPTSPAVHVSPPSDSSVSSHSIGSSPQLGVAPPPVCCPDVRAALDEVSARLKAATSENGVLRTRVADLVRENRHLRASLDAARKQVNPNPLLLGLAQMSAEAAGALASALQPRQPAGKKRKRAGGAAAGKTLACLVLMCGFFFGTPGVLNGEGADRTDANLPAIWTSGVRTTKRGALATTNRAITTPPVRPSLCMRTLEQLPPPELASGAATTVVKEEDEVIDNKDDVSKVGPTKVDHSSSTSMEPAKKKRRTQFSYVMCRDTEHAVEQVSACQEKLERGKQCGAPHSISLIMPAAALRGDDHDPSARHDEEDEYAEVLCNIVSVARIPASHNPNVVSGVAAARAAMSMRSASVASGLSSPVANVGARPGLGRVLATVREEVVGT